MNLAETVVLLRRKAWLVVAAAIVGLAAGWATAPGDTGTVSYQATNVLIADGTAPVNLPRVALLTTSGAVPTKVAAALDMDRSAVVSSLSTAVDPTVATIAITARGGTPRLAESLAAQTAEELIGQLASQAAASYDATTEALTADVAAARAEVDELREQIADRSDDQDVLEAQLAAAQSDLAQTTRALDQHQDEPAPQAPLRVLEVGSASAVGSAGVRAPNSKPARALLLATFAVLLAAGSVVGLDRLDSRIRTKRVAEEAFRLPVVAEVPVMPDEPSGTLVALTQPSSAFVEAYRTLRTMVALWSPDGVEDDGHRVVVVTSPTASEGKTTTVAHLAAMLAEVGRSVIIISGDLRKPRVHTFFRRSAEPGLTTILARHPDADLAEFDLSTPVRGVRLVASGAPTENPAPVLEAVGAVIRHARTKCDFVLVDAPPLLVANDAVELAGHADGVLVVAKSGQTTVDAASKTAELVERLELPVIGVVLVAAEAAHNSYGYYRNRYYAEPEPKKGLRPFWARRPPSTPPNGNGAGVSTPDAHLSNGPATVARKP